MIEIKLKTAVLRGINTRLIIEARNLETTEARMYMFPKGNGFTSLEDLLDKAEQLRAELS